MTHPTEPRYGSESHARVSQSSVETYLRCGLRYLADREFPTGRGRSTIPMAIGSAVDAAANLDARATRDLDERPSIAAMVDCAVEAYDQAAPLATSPWEIARGRDDAAAATRVYATRVAHLDTHVLSSQSVLAAKLENVELVGTPDRVTLEGIGDLKVGRSWTQAMVDRSRQLSAMSLLWARRGPEPETTPTRVWIDSIHRTPRGWSHERIYSVRTEAHRESYAFIAVEAVKAIRKNVFLPASEGAWWCSRDWCPHHSSCPAVSGQEAR